jgi:hypothetical protein
MNLVYPLLIPATPAPRSVTFGANNLVSAAISPFTGSSQITTWPGEWWEAEIGLPAMTLTKAAPWVSFLTGLRGQSGTFLLGDPLRTSPQGVASGSPLVNGNQSGGSQQLSTAGWLASQTGILKAGDYFQIGSANLLTYSQDWTNSAWTKTHITVGTGITDPNSGSTADSLTGSNANSYIQQSVTAGPGTYTFSVYLKAASSFNVMIGLMDVNNTIATLTCPVTTSWTRFSVTGTYTSANTEIIVQIGGSGTIGSGTVVDSWGAQLEPGSNANPYLLTTSVALPLVQRLHMLTTDANSDSSGNATLNIFPAIRPEGAFNGQIVVTSSPQGLFRLVSNWRSWQYDFTKMYAVDFKAVEAL